jgi:hypothetical protein
MTDFQDNIDQWLDKTFGPLVEDSADVPAGEA